MQELIQQHEAARRLGIHVTTFRSWVREGRIPAYRVGQRFTRVDWSEVLAAIATTRASQVDQSAPDEHSRGSLS